MNNTSRTKYLVAVLPSVFFASLSFSADPPVVAASVALVSSGSSQHSHLVELVFLAEPIGGKNLAHSTVQVRKVSGTGSERKEETFAYDLSPGEKKPIGFGAIPGEKTEKGEASYIIISVKGPRLF